jgi:hypothetical protein
LEATPRFVCGRPKGNFDQEPARQWHVILNAGTQPGSVGRWGKEQRFFNRLCGRHLALISPEAVNKNPHALECTICQAPEQLSAGKKGASSYEIKAARDIASVARCPVVTQARTVKNCNGGTDFTIMLLGGGQLDVEVDGEQHFESDYHDTSKEAQRATDQVKDGLSLQQGRRRVRLHYRDAGMWVPKIRGAIILASLFPNYGFNLYTPSYKQKECFVRLPSPTL